MEPAIEAEIRKRLKRLHAAVKSELQVQQIPEESITPALSRLPLLEWWLRFDQFDIAGNDAWYELVSRETRLPVLVLDSELKTPARRFVVKVPPIGENPADDQFQELARLVVCTYAAERDFISKILALRQLGQVAIRVRTTKENALLELVGDPSTYYNVGVILLVGALENFLRDCLYAFSHQWFKHGRPTKKQAGRVLQSFRVRGEPVKQGLARLDGAADYVAELIEIIQEWRLEGRMPSFQDLSGVRDLYSIFFGVRLGEVSKKVDHNAWEDLQRTFRKRHKIIHVSHDPSISHNWLNRTIARFVRFQRIVLLEVANASCPNSNIRL